MKVMAGYLGEGLSLMMMESRYHFYLYQVRAVKKDMSDKLGIYKYKGMEVQIIQNVRAYIDKNNVTYINAEDAARGLGFTEDKNGVEYVRWNRINTYFTEFGFSQEVGKDDFIPEGMFYRLAMKANNEPL